MECARIGLGRSERKVKWSMYSVSRMRIQVGDKKEKQASKDTVCREGLGKERGREGNS